MSKHHLPIAKGEHYGVFLHISETLNLYRAGFRIEINAVKSLAETHLELSFSEGFHPCYRSKCLHAYFQEEHPRRVLHGEKYLYPYSFRFQVYGTRTFFLYFLYPIHSTPDRINVSFARTIGSLSVSITIARLSITAIAIFSIAIAASTRFGMVQNAP